MFKSIIFSLLIAHTIFANDCQSLYPEGLPTQGVDKVLCKKRFVIGYSYQTKTPMWALETLQKRGTAEAVPLMDFVTKEIMPLRVSIALPLVTMYTVL